MCERDRERGREGDSDSEETGLPANANKVVHRAILQCYYNYSATEYALYPNLLMSSLSGGTIQERFLLQRISFLSGFKYL